MSDARALKLDPQKQKIVDCSICKQSLVVGKFAKNGQTCETSGYRPTLCPKRKEVEATTPVMEKPKSAREKLQEVKEETNGHSTTPESKFASDFVKMMAQLDFDFDSKRRYVKKYDLDGGGVVYVYPHVTERPHDRPRLEYFSVIIQRAVGVNEEFRRFMPPDAASDCELLAAELAHVITNKSQIGMVKCDSCGEMTDEFGVDQKHNKVLCIKPGNCFRKQYTHAGAQTEN